MQSPTFKDWIVNGIAPDGTVDWTFAGIVSGLREAIKSTPTHEGWTRLDQATAYLAAHHPEQTPQKYGCRTWPQVLHESRAFDLQYQPAEDGKRIGRFRERIR